MPIDYKFDVQTMTKDRFHTIDYQVMRHAFDIHNELGCLYRESIYHSELLNRCKDDGFGLCSEAEIVVSRGTFSKSFFIDALIENGAVYELKTAEDLNGFHESQLLNYMFLLNLCEGKLINFTSPSVQHRFVSTTVEQSDRYTYDVDVDRWDNETASDELVCGIVHDVLGDWGAYLDVGLYKEALFHFLGGEEHLLRPLEICSSGKAIGHQKFHLLEEGTLLHVSSTIRNAGAYQKQLERLFQHTDIWKIHWINFCRQRIILITLKK